MDFVTVATFDNPPGAHLAVGMLSEAGIDAMLRNERIVADAWDLGQASQGVEVRVLRADAVRAHAMIEQAVFGGGVATGEALAEPDDEVECDDDDTMTPGQRADHASAGAALRAAVLGLVIPPLQIYSLWLLVGLTSRPARNRRTPEISRRVRKAFLFDLFTIAVCGIIAVHSVQVWLGN